MFESKSEILHGDFECEDIAGRLYLWKPIKYAAPHLPSSVPNRLIITAHGYRRTCHMFRIKRKMQLNFYSRDKFAVRDPGLRTFYEGEAIPVETLKQGANCYNYILSKYPNSSRNQSHNKMGESYQTINRLMQEDYEKRGQALLGALSRKLQNVGMKAENYERRRKIAISYIAKKPAAILTVRNRRMRADVNLEWALDALHRAGYNFTVIDCLFCRVNLFTGLSSLLPFGPDYSDEVQMISKPVW